MYYDLHIHTTDSDGALSSVDLLKKANDKGLEYLCITDHDYISNKNIEFATEAGLPIIRKN